MTTLNWLTASEIVLTAKVVANPSGGNQDWDRLSNVQVALQEGFVHIDPRSDEERGRYGVAEDIFIVPASSIVTIKYKQG